jgi:putative transposase
MAGEGLPVQASTRVLNVTDSGYYAWRTRDPSARAVRHAWVTEAIRQVHRASRGTYGYRRVHAELALGRGPIVGHGTVELLMARAGLEGVTGAPTWRRARPDLLAGELVDRRFAREGVDQLWVAAPPSIRPGRERSTAPSCWTCARGGWSVGRSTPHRPRRWSPTRWAWPSTPADRRRARSSTPITARSSGPGPSPPGPSSPTCCPPGDPSPDCYDNAVIESFWSRKQVELLDRQRWRTRLELANAIFDYLEIFHNRRRRHSALGRLTPIEFENRTSITVA